MSERAKVECTISVLESQLKSLTDRFEELRSEIKRTEGKVFALKKVLLGEIDVSSERIRELEEHLRTEKEKSGYAHARIESLNNLLVSVREIRELIDAA